ncbi:uncharacterized protein N7515_001160 [Penicillium bovifimosum]|uniref:Uncharacterized protein n=1 Tax=Penicillium bovifimosum TaxID=126998 RepID=A0A9W9HH27_9EURO|nr:uncharacterized protein N7515_001160 [Penicillium bovifimosum]KAJ5146596.1 hypothetical protein N7515_001160 [Penicillium bovifimosum]
MEHGFFIASGAMMAAGAHATVMSVKVEVPRVPERAIAHSSSAATEVNSDALKESDGHHSKPANWKRELPNQTTTGGEWWTIRPRGFGDWIYSWTKNRRTDCWAWKWTVSRLQADSPDVIADTLSQQSSRIFQRIRFDEFVYEASGQSSEAIKSFRWQYNALSWRLFRWCIRKHDMMDRLSEVQQAMQRIAADPFILDTIKSTCLCVEEGRYSEPELEQLSRLIIKPLQAGLRQPTSINDLQLRILEFRFRGQYHGLDTNWQLPLDTQNNKLLQQFSQTEIPVVAESLSREDLALYRQLKLDAITRNYLKPNQVRHDLNVRWDHLCRSVEECTAAEAGIDMEIAHLAQEFGYLVNWEQNFRAYRESMQDRENMGYSAALHFLLPAAIAAREGDYTVAQKAIKACEAYNVGSLYAAADNTFAETRSLSSATTVNAGGYFRSAGNLIEYSTPTRNSLTDTVFSRGIEKESRCVPFLMPFFFCCAD